MLSSLRVVDHQQGWFVITFAVVATAGLLTCTSFVKSRTATAEIAVEQYLLAQQSAPLPANNMLCRRTPWSIEQEWAIIQSHEFNRRLARRCAVDPAAFELAAERTPTPDHLRLRVTSRSSTSAKRLADGAAAEYVRLRTEARGGAYRQTMNYLTRMEAESRRRLTELKRHPRLDEADRRAYGQAQKAWIAYSTKLAEIRPGLEVFGPRARVISWSRERGAANAQFFVGGWLLAALVIALGAVQLRERRG